MASVFFSSDVANPDTYAKFYADIEMFQIPMTQPDPALHMRRYHFAQRGHQGEQVAGHEFPALGQQGLRCGDRGGRERNRSGQARGALHQGNDLMWQDTRVHPGDASPEGGAAANTLRPVISGWANDTDNLQDWYREATG